MDDQQIDCENWLDDNDNPAGGCVSGVGLEIVWQNGPLGRGEDRQEPNGAFVETVIRAAKQRLEHYNAGKFHCQENTHAINHLEGALYQLSRRTQRREERGVEGTHTT